MATKGIESWHILTSPLLIDASSSENRSEYPKPYAARN